LIVDTRQVGEIKYQFHQKGGKASGFVLSRREEYLIRQLKYDWIRIVPMTLISIIPGAVLTFPWLMQKIPSLLPSGFQNELIQVRPFHGLVLCKCCP
jgi:hypothetical protein